MRSIIITLLCCTMVVSGYAQSKKKKAQKSIPVFTVNKKPVTSEEFIYLYQKNHQNNKEDFSQEKIQEYLDLFINFKLKVEEARHRGLDTTAAFVREYNSYKDELRKPYLPEGQRWVFDQVDFGDRTWRRENLVFNLAIGYPF